MSLNFSSDRPHMDWFGLTTPKLRWYDRIFLMVPLPFVLFNALELHSIVTTGGKHYPETGGIYCCVYIPSAEEAMIGSIKFLCFAAAGYLSYVLPPRRFLRPAGRLICYAVTSLVTLTFCVLALEAIGVAHIL